MEHTPSTHLVLGFKVLEAIPGVLRPLVSEIVACYRRRHSDLRAVYVIGSVAVGEWVEGVSDIDVVGVVEHTPIPDDENARRVDLLELGTFWPHVSFVNNSALSLAALHDEKPDVMVVGRARIIAVTGLRVWGDDGLDFQEYMPTVETMAYGRTARAKMLMNKCRSGVVNEPFRSNPHLLARSAAKAALRVLSGITILRGAVFYVSPQQTVAAIAEYAPEAVLLAQQAIAVVNGLKVDPSEAMDITDQAIELFGLKKLSGGFLVLSKQ